MGSEYSKKAALVTGGARGIGKAIATALAGRGWRVAVADNAGITGPDTGPVEKLALAEWNRRIGVNLAGMFLMAKHAVPHLRAARGAIVNIALPRRPRRGRRRARRLPGLGRRGLRHRPELRRRRGDDEKNDLRRLT